MDADFGIVPMPKSDETQENYYCSTHPLYVSLSAIPITNPDPETTGAILSSMNYLSQKYLNPAIYETTFTDKVLRDETSVEMLELIRTSRVFDMGYYFNFGNVSSMLSDFASRNKTDFASSYAKNEKRIQLAIDKFKEQLQ